MNKIEKVLLVLVFFVFVVPFVILTGIRYQDGNPEPEQVFCTMEAKMCPDGSYVGRSGPKCEFAECPKVEGSVQVKFNQKILNNGVYITPLSLVSDSRCPSSVTCIWAGTVVIKIRLEEGTFSEEKEIELGNTVLFRDKTVTLERVTPGKEKTGEIPSSNYIFTLSAKLITE